MWSIYSRAISLAPGVDVACGGEVDNAVTKEALAANAARNLVVSLPYAVENHCGIDAFFVCTESGSGKTERKPCPTGTIQFFRFDAPCGGGYGGRRLYGQDVLQLKSLTVYVGNATIDVVHMDSEIGHKRRAHDVGDGLFLISHVTRDGKSTVSEGIVQCGNIELDFSHLLPQTRSCI
jgi:vacuolar protein sorting-associated protein 13A/C